MAVDRGGRALSLADARLEAQRRREERAQAAAALERRSAAQQAALDRPAVRTALAGAERARAGADEERAYRQTERRRSQAAQQAGDPGAAARAGAEEGREAAAWDELMERYGLEHGSVVPPIGVADKFVANLLAGAGRAAVGLPTVPYLLATDPKGFVGGIAEGYRHTYGPLLHGDLGEFGARLYDDPFPVVADLLGLAGAAAGTGARVSAAGRAVAARPAGASAARAAARGFRHPQVRGLLEFARSKRGRELVPAHLVREMEGELRAVLDTTPARRGLVEGVKADVRATRKAGKAKAAEHGRVLAGTETLVREASDGLRAGMIYLRPGYLPNNWGGNTALNLAHQGFLAPVNLAKSFVISSRLGAKRARVIKRAMGQGVTEAVHGTGRGYVKAVTKPVVEGMSKLADDKFREAAFLHEARRAGYHGLDDVGRLIDDAAADGAKLRELAEIAVKANEEIVRFGRLTGAEQGVLKHLFFVYNWTKGATRYAARFPAQHPVQTAAYARAGAQGSDYLDEVIGGMPSWVRGAIPVRFDADGNPTLVSPFNLNPFGTAIGVGEALAGTAKVLAGRDFDRFSEEDLIGLVNPLVGEYLQKREGGRPYLEQLERDVAVTRLVEQLRRPGEWSEAFPTTRTEALGGFLAGSAFPRKASRKALAEAAARERGRTAEGRYQEQLRQIDAALERGDIDEETAGEFRTLARQQLEQKLRTKQLKDRGLSEDEMNRQLALDAMRAQGMTLAEANDVLREFGMPPAAAGEYGG